MFSSKEIKGILKVSDCELMHLRISKHLTAVKTGKSYFYDLPANKTVLDHPVGQKLLNWYKTTHQIDICNEPESPSSKIALEKLVLEILLPIYRKYPKLNITYGFTSAILKRHIAKHSPRGTAPNLDQHASCELNNAQNAICDRGGAACDFIVPDVSSSELVRFIVEHLNYDRIYYYGNNRPLHVSNAETPNKHLQLMAESENGRRYPIKKTHGEAALLLAKELPLYVRIVVASFF